MEQLEKQLTEMTTEMKSFAGKAQEEIKNLGTVQTETKGALDSIKATMATMQTQLDAVDLKMQHRHAPGGDEQKSLGESVTSSPEFAEAQAGGFMGRKPINMVVKSGAFPRERKTNITNTNLGSAVTGVLVPSRIPGVVGLPQQALRIRDLMNVVHQGEGNSFDFVYQQTRTNLASPQTEASAKSQSYLNWQSTSGAIRTIAHWVKVSRQALSDVPWLRGQIDGELVYGLKVKEESEILSGDGTGVHLNGIITQATAFDTTLLSAVAGWTRLDILRWAKLQARLAGLATYAPTGFVLNPTDLAHLEVTKDSYGHYIIGDPRTGVEVDMVWKLPVVESDSIASGTFLVGAFYNGAELRERQQVGVDISYEDGSNFTENMATVLCEERIGLAVKKANSFVTGSFNTSPANQ